MKLKLIAVFLMVFALFAAVSAQAADAQTTNHSAQLTWVASPAQSVAYSVYRSNASGALSGKTKIQSGLSAVTFTDVNLTANTMYCYQVTATAVGMAESSPSNEGCGTTGQDGTAAPGQITIIIK